MKRIFFFLPFLFFCKISFAQNSTDLNPQSIKEFLSKTTVSGNLRYYYFVRDFESPSAKDQTSSSFGGALNIKSAALYGFSAGASYYAADPFGLNSRNFNRLDATLPGTTVNVLGQTFLEHQSSKTLLRVGNQIIKTPWVNDSDSRMIPATYQGIFGTFSPLKDLDITAFRTFRYKSRTSKNFDRSNLYDPTNYGGSGIPQLNGVPNKGIFSTGVGYKINQFKTQAWYYRFFDFANFIYADAIYNFKFDSNYNPFISAQLGRQWGDGKNYLNQFGYGKTDSRVFGALIGLDVPNGQLSLAYNKIPRIAGAFNNGDLVSPYTTGYVTDPLFTSSMIAGLVEKAAGSAYKAGGFYQFFDKQLKIAASAAKYFTAPTVHNTVEYDIDVTFKFNKTILKNLSLRNRFGVLYGNQRFGRFFYNRVMIQYDF